MKKNLIDAKLCSAARPEFELKKDPGLFSIYLSSADGNPPERAVDAWDGLIAQLRNGLVSDAELKRARNLAEYALYDDRDGAYRYALPSRAL